MASIHLAGDRVGAGSEDALARILADALPSTYQIVRNVTWTLSAETLAGNANGIHEADFVILHPTSGVLVLETKSGSFRYDSEGRWWHRHQANSHEQRFRGRDPLIQARENRFALKAALARISDIRPIVDRVRWAHAAAVIDCEYPALAASIWDRRTVLDAADLTPADRLVAKIHDCYEYFEAGGALSSDELRSLLSALLDPPLLSAPLVRFGMRIRRTIDILTREQAAILSRMRHNRRATITGCAGSGKTILAIEKASRMAHEHDVLYLCHNRNLAAHLRSILRDTRASVFDVASFLEARLHPSGYNPTAWEDPEDGPEHQGAVRQLRRGSRFDVVIVDEAQDLAPRWWNVVSAVLRDSRSSYLWVFLDDQQRLYTRPVPDWVMRQARLDLSRNCRNAGNVFELVAAVADRVPSADPALEGVGHVALLEYPSLPSATSARLRHGCPETPANVAAPYLRRAFWGIRELLQMDQAQIFFIAAGSAMPGESSLAGLSLRANSDWQTAVRATLTGAAYAMYSSPSTVAAYMAELALSDSGVPTKPDREAIAGFVQRLAEPLAERSGVPNPRNRTMRWTHDAEGTPTLTGPSSIEEVVWFFSQTPWWKGLRNLREYRVVSCDLAREGEPCVLHTVDTVKGLEADGVVLYVHDHPRFTVTSRELYVGISRARVALAIVAPLRALRGHGMLLEKLRRWDLFERLGK